MIKKTIKFEDYNGVERTEDFFFNLSKSELSKMELSVDGGLTAKLETIVKKLSGPSLMKAFEEVILMSYGEKSDDGTRFVKYKMVNGEKIRLADEFAETPAYDNLFMELLSDQDAAQKFIKGIMPAEVQGQMTETPATIAAKFN